MHKVYYFIKKKKKISRHQSCTCYSRSFISPAQLERDANSYPLAFFSLFYCLKCPFLWTNCPINGRKNKKNNKKKRWSWIFIVNISLETLLHIWQFLYAMLDFFLVHVWRRFYRDFNSLRLLSPSILFCSNL